MKNKTVRKLRKKLSKPGLLEVARNCSEKTEDTASGRSFTLADCLMSGLAVFSLKHSSLLQFDKAVHSEKTVRSNLKNLFGVSRPFGFRVAKAS